MKKEIPGFNGRYYVYENGDVESIASGLPKLLKPGKRGKDRKYLFVALSKDGRMKSYSVHRLVAEAFIENTNNLPAVNHKDQNTFNNHFSNLEWITDKDNSKYSFCKTYTFLNPDGEVKVIYDLPQFCEENTLSRIHMVGVHNGYRRSHKGWRSV